MTAYNTRKSTPAAHARTIANRQARALKAGQLNTNRAGHVRRTH